MAIERSYIYEIIAVSKAAKRQIIYCSTRKCWWSGSRETNSRWRGRTRVAKHVCCITHVSNVTGICSPINKGENTPRVQHATSGLVNSQALSWRVTHSPPRSASMFLAYSKESTVFFKFKNLFLEVQQLILILLLVNLFFSVKS